MFVDERPLGPGHVRQAVAMESRNTESVGRKQVGPEVGGTGCAVALVLQVAAKDDVADAHEVGEGCQ